MVDTWTAAARSAFVGLVFTSSDTTPNQFSVSTDVDTTWSSDSDNGSGIKSWTALKYESNANSQVTVISYTCSSASPPTGTLGESASIYKSVSSHIHSSECSNKPSCLQNPSSCSWTDFRRRRRRTSDNRRRYRRDATPGAKLPLEKFDQQAAGRRLLGENAQQLPRSSGAT